MRLRYLFDEHLRGDLWKAVQFHNKHSPDSLDVIRVGDPLDLPLSSKDAEILVWAELDGRIVVSRDKRTMFADLAAHVRAGRSSPGLFIVRRSADLATVLAFLSYAGGAGDELQWRDQADFIP
jgi:Domain of unknown function (DUF5615)